MSELRTITDEDLVEKGVMPLADVPGLSASEMKYKFEEIVRAVVIPIFNQNMQEISNFLFYDPETGSTYLTLNNLITSYARVLSATASDVDKTANVVAIKDMDTAIKELITAAVGRIITLETTVSGHTTSINTLNGKVTALENNVWVVFRANGGTGTMAQVSKTPVSGSIILPSTQSFEKEGYTFAGWSLTADGAAAYQLGDTVSNIENLLAGNVLELFATWTENEP